METLMTYMAAFGLATGAGAKAFIPILALGALSYTPYFELADRFAWIADPVVMAVLGVLVVLELVVDAHPDLGRFSDLVSYLPKIVAGFIGFAAVTGRLDSDVAQLGASGVLGGGTAAGVHWLRNRVRAPFRDLAEDAHEGAGKLATLTEAGASATMAGTAVVAPPVSMALALVFVGGSLAVARRAAGRRLPCPHCGGETRPGAIVCPHCRHDL
ncbi:MAG: DUF4126 family protein [Thermoanaerobaculales bacterium]|nr:DUF4126 family protein [Thermoanaerobaculales bacterium]